MNERINKETFVAFATQKGGVGKSTVTALVANYVHNVMGLDVAVIDCDEPQHSIAGLRDKETVLIEKNDSLKAVLPLLAELVMEAMSRQIDACLR